MKLIKGFWKASVLILLITIANTSFAQILSRQISIDVSRQPLEEVLEILSNKGNFYFSYNSNIIRKDSLVTLSVRDKSIGEVLQQLFSNGYEFKESGNYIILRRIPLRLKLVTTQAVSEDRFYSVSGYIVDEQTGEKVSDASIYDKLHLASAITNNNGYFKLRLKSKYKKAALTVSKQFYEDTTVVITPAYNQELIITIVPVAVTETTITISPQNYVPPSTINLEVPLNDSMKWRYTYVKTDSVLLEKSTLGRWFVSSRQKIQSLNLHRFFTARPYQVSIVPGLSSNGKLNSQVINKFSLNLFGGYSGGVMGFELGGLFNIDKKDVQWVQIGGIFNLVGGSITGVQIGGISNTVFGGGNGAQIGGITNYVKSDFTGAQIGGIYNHIGGNLKGVQIGGITSFTNRKTNGVQISGIANISTKELRGVQVAGIFNYTRRLKGVQVGLINVSHESDGYSIGLINIVAKGYHKLSLSTNEVLEYNAAFKTGNSKLYSILLGGYNSAKDERVWSFGYGIGTEVISGKWLSVNTELSSQYLYLGSWDHLNLQNKAGMMLNIKFGKFFSIFGGPTYSVYVSDQTSRMPGYKFNIPPSGYKTNKLGNTVTGWFGWTAGVNFF